jgi:hypothetical protein
MISAYHCIFIVIYLGGHGPLLARNRVGTVGLLSNTGSQTSRTLSHGVFGFLICEFGIPTHLLEFIGKHGDNINLVCHSIRHPLPFLVSVALPCHRELVWVIWDRLVRA